MEFAALTFAFLFSDVQAFLASRPPIDPDPKSLAVPSELDLRARALVKQLGRRDYFEREEAQRELKTLGRFALPALNNGLQNSPIPEVARRCEELLPRAEGYDLRAKVECFAADTTGKYKHDLPGGKVFFAVVGKGEGGRKLLADLLLSPHAVYLKSMDGDGVELKELTTDRRAELFPPRPNGGGGPNYVPRTNATPLEIAAILLAECGIPETGANSFGRGTNSSSLVLQPAFRNALESDPRREAFTAIASKWLETRSDLRSQSFALSAATTLKLPVAVTLAKKVLENENATPMYKASAMSALARMGDETHLPLILAQFNDSTQANRPRGFGNSGNRPILVKDAALAMALLLTNQEPSDYGFKLNYESSSDSWKYNATNYYFDDYEGDYDSDRDAAFAKWSKWSEKNLKKKK